MGNVTSKKQQVIRVEGIAEEKNKAFANALSQVQNHVLKESKDVTLRIEPIAVNVVKAEEETYVERFLFVLFPRVRHNFRVTLDVTADITMIEMDAVHFIEKKRTNPVGFSLPFFKNKIKKEAN
ncbi:DUF4312 family protein [Enterococcus rivorum]|uniref:Cytoplasmic protein n=1 Tax=Enterococcus rivorum TaxID=762845 RepID=A0A1E5L1L5_9ENTE|nr:DUF4312 family protein [Enterococcus rivorum]MBP2098740.1 uncharacterized protein (TIGR03578 family) [Enterococcus rivorum]OEH83931.1 hypothetical protein BCR26_00205 [Enterococcus rivorum]